MYLSSSGHLRLISMLSDKCFEFYVMLCIKNIPIYYYNCVGAKSSIWKTKKGEMNAWFKLLVYSDREFL